ncbi:UDP-N-acetylmuramoyl-L-alanyl-D-glutamate--2,6-diaminopimelate ligase [Gluconobacter kanchanaburiensis]|uniref:UDP-N-acetylmuramoyl-L-alanyl-D-glutamate--2,6-diaminopimelate ligase n=1 Tax=Gluconobacter kanchanaburiensis NBRC 103587 TaxID=1307948 RepID=A0A511BA60_9PROT|nr:UDP-N-acetylmuramoyl-L-alanyl-D-glutamate--2,6-diaminopimelate ligase [Gluconobacter kanchanaburiensis]MBF0862965.1 UDP-N-acetylmuramoyl-L-alanyl-D-glutamate--2,6-diaminopimelate ligase [Gluconobacter kanchanaburiensis]GBR70633.1 UDP-N-acetylmuramoylalanyl-D-glutamate--2, 6-diaminopimelate ligase [Gluconobacter kanchanaburiensis NBRC 103587]GEK97298.1 UDP-N-acetylmuramoyl-L-alanyl-D-glutamate--2,6-diaminopimelate ligase [Gluconobacter kanchanaburiensis NBRC 103587]
MRLSQLFTLCGTSLPPLSGDPDIISVTADSRTAGPGSLFFALRGVKQDGTAFIVQALSRGASAVIADHDPTKRGSGPGVIERRDAKHLLARMASILAGPQPSCIAAITGTNGKSSTADFLRQLWILQGHRAASLGTLGLISDTDVPQPPSLTTPDPVSLSRTLAALAREGVGHVALEASSHGLEQHRLDGLKITAAGFSNLTRDHLDYHLTIDAYRSAKLHLFSSVLAAGGPAAVNADMDPETFVALRDIAARRSLKFRTVGRNGSTLRLISARPTPSGQILRLMLHGEELPEITLTLPGSFQADNVMLAAAMCWEKDEDAHKVLALLPELKGVHGRCERAITLAGGAAAYVDYAHTPDALECVLSSLRPHTAGKLVVVFGAGGDRDKGKRPLMGAVAARLADLAIVTDDNPRTEDPSTIRSQIMAACPNAQEIADRRSAIAAGLEALSPGDILVVAGKGHEQGQIVGTEILPFDDRLVIRELAGAA